MIKIPFLSLDCSGVRCLYGKQHLTFHRDVCLPQASSSVFNFMALLVALGWWNDINSRRRILQNCSDLLSRSRPEMAIHHPQAVFQILFAFPRVVAMSLPGDCTVLIVEPSPGNIIWKFIFCDPLALLSLIKLVGKLVVTGFDSSAECWKGLTCAT